MEIGNRIFHFEIIKMLHGWLFLQQRQVMRNGVDCNFKLVGYGDYAPMSYFGKTFTALKGILVRPKKEI